MRIAFLKTKESVKIGHQVDTVFRNDIYDISFKDGFFIVESSRTKTLTYIPASNVAQFDVIPQASEQKLVASKKKSA